MRVCVCACVSFRPNRSSHTGTRGSSSCLASFLFALFRLRSPSVTRWVSSLPRAARPSVGAEAGVSPRGAERRLAAGAVRQRCPCRQEEDEWHNAVSALLEDTLLTRPFSHHLSSGFSELC